MPIKRRGSFSYFARHVCGRSLAAVIAFISDFCGRRAIGLVCDADNGADVTILVGLGLNLGHLVQEGKLVCYMFE